MSNWIAAYVHGDYDELLAWVVKTFPSVKPEVKYELPTGLAWIGPKLWPNQVSGSVTDVLGNKYDTYIQIPKRNDILALIAFTDSALLEGVPATCYVNKTPKEMANLLPEFAVGQAIPYLT